MLTEEQVKELIAGSMDGLKEDLHKSIKKELVKQLDYSISRHVNATVEEFYKSEIAPALREHLLLSKDGIIKHLTLAMGKIGSELQTAMVEEFKERMKASSYQRSQILKALFGAG